MNEWDMLRLLCPKLFKHGISICCGIGWYRLVHNLCLDIERILERDEEKHRAIEGEENEFLEMYAVQIKEKYGTLRFYMSCETDEIYDLIREAEMASREVCEMCGNPGKWINIFWCMVRCDKCYKEIGNMSEAVDVLEKSAVEGSQCCEEGSCCDKACEVIPEEPKKQLELKRDIIRFNGARPTAINLEHVTIMFLEGKRITFEFYTKAQFIDFDDETAAGKAFEALLTSWSSRVVA